MKKVITLILVALMLLSMLTACEQQTAQTETTPVPAPTAAPTKAPEKGITRAEFVAQLVGYFGWPHPDDYNDIWEDYAIADGLIKYTFNDVKKEDKYGKEIESAYRAGILAPDASGNFEPNREITRQEAAVIFANAWKLVASKKASMYTDAAKTSADALPVITTLAELEIPLGKTDYEFGPDEPLPASEFEKAFQTLKDKVVAPVYALPYQDYIAPRRYIKLYCATPDAVIYFTKDGSEPTNTSKAYSVATTAT